MYQYTVHYDMFNKDKNTWEYNKKYETSFDYKDCHSLASRELEEMLGSFVQFRINKITVD